MTQVKAFRGPKIRSKPGSVLVQALEAITKDGTGYADELSPDMI
jgi:hypothetical protein